MSLSCRSFFKYQSVLCVNGVFKCDELLQSINPRDEIYGSIQIVKLLIKLLMQVTLLILAVTINYRIILWMMLFINSSCKPLKTDPSRDLCTYTTWAKPSFCQINTLINLYASATALLENSEYYGVSLENKRLFF